MTGLGVRLATPGDTGPPRPRAAVHCRPEPRAFQGGPGRPGDGARGQRGCPALCSHLPGAGRSSEPTCSRRVRTSFGQRVWWQEGAPLQEAAPCGPTGLPATPPHRSPGPCGVGGKGPEAPAGQQAATTPPTAPLLLRGLPVRVRAWPCPSARGFRPQGAPPAPVPPRPRPIAGKQTRRTVGARVRPPESSPSSFESFSCPAAAAPRRCRD